MNTVLVHDTTAFAQFETLSHTAQATYFVASIHFFNQKTLTVYAVVTLAPTNAEALPTFRSALSILEKVSFTISLNS